MPAPDTASWPTARRRHRSSSPAAGRAAASSTSPTASTSRRCPPPPRPGPRQERPRRLPGPRPRRVHGRLAPALPPRVHAGVHRLEAALLRLAARLRLVAPAAAPALRDPLRRLQRVRRRRDGDRALPADAARRHRPVLDVQRDGGRRGHGDGRPGDARAEGELPAPRGPTVGGGDRRAQPAAEPRHGRDLRRGLRRVAALDVAAAAAAARGRARARHRRRDAALGALRAVPRRPPDLGRRPAGPLLRDADPVSGRAGRRALADARDDRHVQPPRGDRPGVPPHAARQRGADRGGRDRRHGVPPHPHRDLRGHRRRRLRRVQPHGAARRRGAVTQPARASISVLCPTAHPGPLVAANLRDLRPHVDEILVAADARAGAEDLGWYASVADRVLRFEFSGSNRHWAWLAAQAAGDWVLLLDGDEITSEALNAALPELTRDRRVNQYRLPLRWLWPDAGTRLAGPPWGADRQLRLLRNDGRLFFYGRKHLRVHPDFPVRYADDLPIYHLDLVLGDVASRRDKARRYDAERFGLLTAEGLPFNAAWYLPEDREDVALEPIPAGDRDRIAAALEAGGTSPPAVDPASLALHDRAAVEARWADRP